MAGSGLVQRVAVKPFKHKIHNNVNEELWKFDITIQNATNNGASFKNDVDDFCKVLVNYTKQQILRIQEDYSALGELVFEPSYSYVGSFFKETQIPNSDLDVIISLNDANHGIQVVSSITKPHCWHSGEAVDDDEVAKFVRAFQEAVRQIQNNNENSATKDFRIEKYEGNVISYLCRDSRPQSAQSFDILPALLGADGAFYLLDLSGKRIRQEYHVIANDISRLEISKSGTVCLIRGMKVALHGDICALPSLVEFGLKSCVIEALVLEVVKNKYSVHRWHEERFQDVFLKLLETLQSIVYNGYRIETRSIANANLFSSLSANSVTQF